MTLNIASLTRVNQAVHERHEDSPQCRKNVGRVVAETPHGRPELGADPGRRQPRLHDEAGQQKQSGDKSGACTHCSSEPKTAVESLVEHDWMDHRAEGGAGSYDRHRECAPFLEIVGEDGHAWDVDNTSPEAHANTLREKHLHIRL